MKKFLFLFIVLLFAFQFSAFAFATNEEISVTIPTTTGGVIERAIARERAQQTANDEIIVTDPFEEYTTFVGVREKATQQDSTTTQPEKEHDGVLERFEQKYNIKLYSDDTEQYSEQITYRISETKPQKFNRTPNKKSIELPTIEINICQVLGLKKINNHKWNIVDLLQIILTLANIVLCFLWTFYTKKDGGKVYKEMDGKNFFNFHPVVDVEFILFVIYQIYTIFAYDLYPYELSSFAAIGSTILNFVLLTVTNILAGMLVCPLIVMIIFSLFFLILPIYCGVILELFSSVWSHIKRLTAKSDNMYKY